MINDVLNPYYWLLKCDQMIKGFPEKSFYKSYAPVISVGNLNTGGSGKTPFIVYLASLLSQQLDKKKILIVSKSYKTQAQQPLCVDQKNPTGALIYGDEPFLLKSILKDKADIWSGPVKWKTLQEAEKHKTYDVVLIDDGFSHYAIKKNLDIVLFDVSRDKQHYRLLPFGRLREPLSHLQRSNLVVLTKKEGVDEHQVSEYRQLIQQYQKNCIDSQYITDSQNIDIEKDYTFFCGLGHPENVVNELRRLGVRLNHIELLNDHSLYTEQWQKNMLETNDPDTNFLTTRKDFVKLSYQPLIDRTTVVDVQVVLSPHDERVLCEKISALF